MTNEEMLEVVTGMFNKLSSDNEKIKSDLSNLKIHIENETSKNIQLLVEGQIGIREVIEPLRALPDKVDNLEQKVDVISQVVQGHSGEINKLAKVK